MQLAASLDVPVDPLDRQAHRRCTFRFDPRLRLMTTLDGSPAAGGLWANTKGAPEAVVAQSSRLTTGPDQDRPLTEADRAEFGRVVDGYAQRGLRVMAVAHRQLDDSLTLPLTREEAERDLCLLGVVAMADPPRPEVVGAILRAHRAGVRIHVVTGDNGTTAGEIARRVGIGTGPAGGGHGARRGTRRHDRC